MSGPVSASEESVIIDLDASGPPIARMPREGVIALRVIENGHRVVLHVFRADDRRVRIGRASGVHVALDGPTVARVHATIEQANEAYVVRDTGSPNGTFLDGQRIDHVTPIAVGNVVGIHPFEIEVMALGDVPGEREQTFLDAFDDDAMRAMYAEWLEDQGRHGGAEMVRGRVAYPPTDFDAA